METRRVQQMRIRADRADQARSAAVQLEDALRTASFPNLPRNGVVYIRRLDLGRIGPRPDRSKLSRHIDERLLSLPASAIRRGDAATDLTDAEAVWFPDPVAPLLVCAERILRNLPLRAWYWQRVLGLKKPPIMPPHLGMIMARAEQLARPELAVLALIRHMARLDGLVRLVETLPMETVRRQVSWLLPQVVMGTPYKPPVASDQVDLDSRPQTEALSSVLPRPSLSMRWYPMLSAAARRWPQETPRVAWLALVVHSLEGQRLRSGQWQAEMREITALKLTAGTAPAEDNGVHDAAPQATVAPVEVEPLRASSPQPEPDSTTARENTTPEAPRQRQRSPARKRPLPETDFDGMGAGLWGGEYSPVSGLPFMLPVWFRLGLAESLERHEELQTSDFVARLLHRLGWWLGVEDDDPMLAWLPSPQHAAPTTWTAPDGWWRVLEPWLSRYGFLAHDCGEATAIAGLTDRVILRFGADLESPVRCRAGKPWPDHSMMDRLADSWLRMSAGWLHRRDLNIRRLVLRPGAVAATDTHVDICFHMNHTDLAVRMAALDLDPGWVPSLGRVIQYHYVNRDA